MQRHVGFAAILLLGCAQASKVTAGAPAAIPVAVPDGAPGIGFDDLRFAPELRRVVVPAGRTGNLVLIDPGTREVTAIPGFSHDPSYGGGHGAGTTSADEGGGLLYAIDRNTKELHVVDPAKGAIVASANLAAGPDYVRYVAARREVWVTEPNAGQIEIFSLPAGGAPSPTRVATVAVPNGPESLVVDVARRRAYTHRWDDRTHAIDLASRAIVATWSNGCAGSRGIALDETRGFLFVGCDEGKAVVLDVTQDGRKLASLSPGVEGVDVIAYNPSLRHLYLPGEGTRTMAILGVSAAGELGTLAIVPTARGAHCVTEDDRGGAWVCSPEDGKLLYFADTLPASPR
ncbi:MAG TPA: hypothetical protein VKE22_09740 [Haliangiales bacterium]|nr:hypothetical protein [Haliangiales bacterium]